jgi:TATA-box binding protein (TBP) (component of TFIID and TFIIIB)
MFRTGNGTINLDAILASSKNATKKENFPPVILRNICKKNETMLLYKNGSFIVTGTSSMKQATETIEKIKILITETIATLPKERKMRMWTCIEKARWSRSLIEKW